MPSGVLAGHSLPAPAGGRWPRRPHLTPGQLTAIADDGAHTRRQACGHIRSLERLGYKVTIKPIDPDTGELTAGAG